MIRRYLPRDIDQLIEWYTHYLSPLGLIAGFLADTFIFLSRVDQLSGLIIVCGHLVISAAAIAFLNAAREGRFSHPALLRIAPFSPVIMQFSFGGLFSAFFSLYSRSAAFPATWLFVAILAALMLGNERFFRFYERVTVQVGIFSLALLSFIAFFVPLIVHRIGDDVFLLSAAIALAILAALLAALFHIAPMRMREFRRRIAAVVIAVFAGFVGFYFADLIPPLPLALKEAGVYHLIEREAGGGYRARGEATSWAEDVFGFGRVVHLVPGESAYVFTSIFAPPGLSTRIAHEWQYRDASTGEWITAAYVPFDIVGGRDAGYRGYSAKYQPAPGVWRVNVLTNARKTIARVSFTVVEASAAAPLVARSF